MVPVGPFIRVILGGNVPITAFITRKSCTEMGFSVGMQVVAGIKATAIFVYRIRQEMHKKSFWGDFIVPWFEGTVLNLSPGGGILTVLEYQQALVFSLYIPREVKQDLPKAWKTDLQHGLEIFVFFCSPSLE